MTDTPYDPDDPMQDFRAFHMDTQGMDPNDPQQWEHFNAAVDAGEVTFGVGDTDPYYESIGHPQRGTIV